MKAVLVLFQRRIFFEIKGDRLHTSWAKRIVIQIEAVQRRVASSRLVRIAAQRRSDGFGAGRSDAIEREPERAQRAIVFEAEAERQRAFITNLSVQ
jgi:hypothetical protein